MQRWCGAPQYPAGEYMALAGARQVKIVAPTLENPDTAHRSHLSANIAVPARLHFGFLDLEGGLGRRFGSLGLALEEVTTRLRAERADDISATGPSAARAERFARRIVESLDLPGGVRLGIEEAIPEHAGLGSGTQLGLAVGAACSYLYGLGLGPREIARRLGRGARSGIGIGAFEQGGLLLDGGRLEGSEEPAPIIARLEFPAAWRVLLIFDREAEGLHGEAELAAFRDLPPFSAELAAHLCRLVLMVALPAAAERDLPRFGRAVAELQEAIGSHFARAQGGPFASTPVAQTLSWLRERGIEGVGQSSWGPTGFALVDGEATGRRLLQELNDKWAGDERLRFMLCRGRNQGSRIELDQPIPAITREMRC